MEEQKVKKREWVKTAAIIFLTIMLLLTFFSNTILNRSLPEVSAQYVSSGTINAKIRGSGTVTANQLLITEDPGVQLHPTLPQQLDSLNDLRNAAGMPLQKRCVGKDFGGTAAAQQTSVLQQQKPAAMLSQSVCVV